ncbi:MAG: hypothetical protein V1891_01535 [bacterium]
MNIIIDLTPILELGSKHPYVITLYLIKMFGWVPIVFVIIWGLWLMWMKFIQDEYVSKIKFILLAIDVPKDNLQTPKAVEQIFAHLAGAHSTPNLIEKYWDGYVQAWFSLEIVSIDGYAQFLIYAPEAFRDLTEAAIYAQYPDAEITEIEDYADKVPQKYPNEEWDLFGTELILVKSECYPIRTYPEFEHAVSEDIFKDPMSAILEMMSTLGKGEQAWIQIIIKPIGQEWIKKCEKEVKKIIKEEVAPAKKGPLEAIFGGIIGGLHGIADSFGEAVFGIAGAESSEKKEKDQYNIVQNLTEGDREVVASIQRKAAKIGYETKIRLVYSGKKEVFKKQRGFNGIFGAIKQFNTNDKNSIKPELKKVITRVNYFFKKWIPDARKTKLVNAYRKRSMSDGTSKISVFNIEELATLWHFPMSHVKAPLIKKTEVKKVEPPFNLPTGEGWLQSKEEVKFESIPAQVEFEEKKVIKTDPPENLPFE